MSSSTVFRGWKGNHQFKGVPTSRHAHVQSVWRSGLFFSCVFEVLCLGRLTRTRKGGLWQVEGSHMWMSFFEGTPFCWILRETGPNPAKRTLSNGFDRRPAPFPWATYRGEIAQQDAPGAAFDGSIQEPVLPSWEAFFGGAADLLYYAPHAFRMGSKAFWSIAGLLLGTSGRRVRQVRGCEP